MTMTEIKQKYIDFYRAGGLPLFKNGKPNRGSSGRCAFWNGFEGKGALWAAGRSKAAYDAGRYCAKHKD